MSRSVPGLAIHVLVGVAIGVGSYASDYLKLGSQISTGVVQIKWTPGQMPIRYRVTNRDVSGVSAMRLPQVIPAARALELLLLG